MKLVHLLVVLLTLSSCIKDTTSVPEENTPVASEDRSIDQAIHTEVTPSTEQNVLQDSPEYAAKNKGELSIQDSETDYEMCFRALTDYYKAVWSGSEIKLDTFIENEYLKQYTQKKIQSQYDVYVKNNLTDSVENIRIGAWEVRIRSDPDAPKMPG